MNLGIRTKTLLAIMPILLLIMASLSWVSYHYSYQIIETELNKQMNLQLEATLKDFRSHLNSYKSTGETIARFTEKGGNSITKNQYAAFLQNAITSNALILGSGVWFEPFQYNTAVKYFGPYAYKDKGQVVYTEDYEKPDYDYPSQEWYKLATNSANSVVWTDPYYDEVTKLTMLTASFPFYDENKKFKGMATIDIGLAELQKTVTDIKVGEKGYAFLLDKNGTFLSDRDSGKIMKVKITEDTNANLAEAGKQILTSKEGRTIFNDGTARYLLYYTQVPDTNWILVLSMPEEELCTPLKKLLLRQVIMAIFAVLLVFSVIIFYTRFITKNINEVKRLSDIMAEGNLREQMNIHTSDEFGQMSQNFNHMIGKLRQLMNKIIDNSQHVAASSQQLTANAEQTAKATEHIANTIQDIASFMENQTKHAEETTNSVSKMSTEISKINSDMHTVTDMTQKTAAQAAEGNKVVNRAINQMNLINDKVTTATSVVNILGDKSRKIDEIITLITNIAGQTNLLALNAAIEAARAGEQGRGFAVVADEVRKLAEQSEAAAKQISTLISEVQAETSNAVRIMSDSTQSVQEGIVMVNQAETSFLEIQKAVKNVSDQSSSITQAMSNISDAITQIVKSVSSIADAAGQTSANIHTAAATTQEQTASMEEIQAAATMLAKLANELDEATNKFQI